MPLMPSYKKDEWGRILQIPPSARSDHVNEVLRRCGLVILAWVEGSEIECRKVLDPNHWTIIRDDERVGFTDKLEFRVIPKVEVTFSMTWKQANEFLKVLENTSFNNNHSREARNVVIKALQDDIHKKWDN